MILLLLLSCCLLSTHGITEDIYELLDGDHSMKYNGDHSRMKRDTLAGIKEKELPGFLQEVDGTNITVGHDIERENPHNVTDLQEDHHDYYNSTYIPNGMDYFVDLTKESPMKDVTILRHKKLSETYRKAYKVKLKFEFPFYGNIVDDIVVTTGGFINIGPRFHSFVHIVHYIAPLMADFNPSASVNSSVYIASGNEVFIVQWTDMVLNGSVDSKKPFTFEIILHKNGSIVLAYKDIPVSPLEISNTTHNVTVGLSDGFIMTYILHDVSKRKLVFHNYIYAYHKVDFLLSNVKSGSAYELTLLPNCIQFKSCATCLSHSTAFKCRWCPKLSRCSDSLDWNRQRWLAAKCDHDSYINSSKCTTPLTSGPMTKVKKILSKGSAAIVGAIIGVMLLILVIAALIMFGYAYTHPSSKSGMWLIEHRPSRVFKTTSDNVSEEELL